MKKTWAYFGKYSIQTETNLDPKSFSYRKHGMVKKTISIYCTFTITSTIALKNLNNKKKETIRNENRKPSFLCLVEEEI